MNRAIRATLFIIFVIALFYTAPRFLNNTLWASIHVSIAVEDIITKILIVVLPCLAYIYMYKRDINIRECLKPNKISIKQIVILVLMGFFIQPFAMLISSITSLFFENKVIEYMNAFVGIPFWLILISMAIMPAIMEEVMMRGIVLYESRDLGIKTAAILNGFLFGLLHRNFSQFFYAVVLGMLFVYIVRITNSLYSTIIIHFIINGTQVVLMQMMPVQNIIESNVIEDIALLQKISGIGFIAIICMICLPIFVYLIKVLIKVSKHKKRLNSEIV
ncbi:MAG TPA: hypothetical protein DEP72_05415 [Clostridiales bacterium]|nr:MAG: hypothetical protein A2Y18_01895 [Clostridiales bacterium GWD2_32_19]HCC07580.1 hypothetical protein [Clostridiales bacterium]